MAKKVSQLMTLFGSVAVVALGAILLWGVDGSVVGINIKTIGLVVMLLGLIGVVVSLVAGSSRTGSRDQAHEALEEERPIYRR